MKSQCRPCFLGGVRGVPSAELAQRVVKVDSLG